MKVCGVKRNMGISHRVLPLPFPPLSGYFDNLYLLPLRLAFADMDFLQLVCMSLTHFLC